MMVECTVGYSDSLNCQADVETIPCLDKKKEPGKST
jgi:hypothetical protein